MMILFYSRTIELGLILAFINIVATNDSSDFQKSLPAEVIWAVPGKDVELPCDITPEGSDQVSMVLWFKDNIGIPVYSLDAREAPVSRAIHWAMSNDLGSRSNFLLGKDSLPSRLKINRVIPSDQGIFRCRIDFNNSPTKNFKVNLTLIAQPKEPVIYDAQGREVFGVAGPFKEGYDLFLSCHVVGGRPRPRVTWWEGDHLLDQLMESVTPTLVVNQYFRGNVSRSLYNTSLKCMATVLDTAPSLVKEVRIEVYLKPQEVKITLLTEVLTSGRPQQYQCDTWGSVPPAKITWLLEGEPIRNAAVTVTHDSNVTQSVLTYRPSAGDNAKELTCRAENPSFPGSILERKMKLIVLYPPVVSLKVLPGAQIDHLREGSDIRLLCQIDSNPKPSQILWFHRDSTITHNESLGIIRIDRRLELLNLTLEQSGDYWCSARNVEGEGRSERITLNVQYAPRCKENLRTRSIGALRRDTVSIRCEVTANPSDVVRFSWTFNKSGNVLPLQGSRVSSSGLSSHVEFTPVVDGDFGTLACWASNSIGRQAEPCMTHIFPARVPEPPTNCTLHNRTSGGLELVCSPSDDGGLQQHFMLEGIETSMYSARYNMNGIRTENSKDMPGFKMLGSQPVFLLRGLQPGKSYRLSVFAINAKGRSDPPVVIPSVNIESSAAKLTSTETNIDEKEEDENNPMAIILGSLIAIGLLIVVGIVTAAGGFRLCRKRSDVDDRTLCPTYDGKAEEVNKELQKSEEAFIARIPMLRAKKMNNSSREGNREVPPPEVDEKNLQIAQEALPPEFQKRNSTAGAKSNRLSLSFALMNNIENGKDADGKLAVKETKFSNVNNLRNEEGEKNSLTRRKSSEESGRRSHPRVTLGPEGQVMRCIITEVSDVNVRNEGTAVVS